MTHPQVTLDIARLAQGGEGVGHLDDGRVVFVAGALPGERVRATPTTLKKRWGRARLDAVLTPSPDRVPPACPHARSCGGCDLWHLDPAREATLKARAAADTLARISRLDLPEHTTHHAPSPTGYRVRATFRLRRVAGDLLVGYHARGSNRVVDVSTCAVLDPALESARLALRGAPVRAATAFVEAAGGGQVVVSLSELQGASAQALERWLVDLCDGAPVRGARADLGEDTLLAGDPYPDAAAAVPSLPEGSPVTRAPAGLFRQANPAVNRDLTARVRLAVAQGAPHGHLLELFGGAGNLTFAVCDLAARVTTVEGAGPASELATRIASAHAPHVTALARSIGAGALDELAALDPDLLLLDPPRAGAREVCEAIGAFSSLQRVVYVACDPASLARDLGALGAAGWRVASLDLFDMFPRTAHVETVAVLEPA
jgi:23S rRNA (uracil1939-C5)-methyltransferase